MSAALANRIETVIVPGVVCEDATDRPCDGIECPGPDATADDADGRPCRSRAVGHVVWLTPDWSRVRTASACGRHLAVARAAGGCLTFGYGCLPPASTLMPMINAEIARRQQQRRPQSFYFAPTGTTGTATFGGMHWRINFG